MEKSVTLATNALRGVSVRIGAVSSRIRENFSEATVKEVIHVAGV